MGNVKLTVRTQERGQVLSCLYPLKYHGIVKKSYFIPFLDGVWYNKIKRGVGSLWNNCITEPDS